ncbi:hypothetical protein DWX08_10675 [Ruminococcus sp. AF18-22]|nr:hypothetical protein DWX08_10675 [Ruminococcus sp. AF18-22]
MQTSNLESYIPIVDFLGEVLGKKYEIILQDFSRPKESIIYIANEGISGKKVGDSFSNIFESLQLGEYEGDRNCNKIKTLPDGKQVKVNVQFLRDESRKVRGCLCILKDITGRNEAIRTLIDMSGDNEIHFSIKEKQNDQQESNVLSIAEDMIDHILKEYQGRKLSRDEKIQIIRFMNEKGIFLIKGTVEMVAERLKTAKVTIYSYLDVIKKE